MVLLHSAIWPSRLPLGCTVTSQPLPTPIPPPPPQTLTHGPPTTTTSCVCVFPSPTLPQPHSCATCVGSRRQPPAPSAGTRKLRTPLRSTRQMVRGHVAYRASVHGYGVFPCRHCACPCVFVCFLLRTLLHTRTPHPHTHSHTHARHSWMWLHINSRVLVASVGSMVG